MKASLFKFGAALSLILLSVSAEAGVLRFDDARTALGDGNKASTFYQASQGITISGNYYGLVGGNGNGDPGNWNLHGTNGSAFLGCNAGNACSVTFSSSRKLSGFSLDLGIPGFAWDGSFLVKAFDGLTQVDSKTVRVSSPVDPGNWASLSFSGLFDSVNVTANFTQGFAFGLDNVAFTEASSVPEPATIGLLGLGFLGFAASRRKAAKSKSA